MRCVDVDRLPCRIPLHDATTRHPAVGAVAMKHPVADFELAWTMGQHGLDGLRHFAEVLGMDALQPGLLRVADLVFFTTDEAEPARREVNPVGDQIPIPEAF